ncbi:oligosaccharide repeat unit polymerase [Rhodococcus fascians]|nr:oligosaccharide repeat unit polymerase [Rhodococcus fascians]
MTLANCVAAVSVAVGLLTVVMTTRLRIGYLISPFSVTVLILVAIFGVRPLVVDYGAGPRLYGYSTNSGLLEATIVGLIAIIAVICGYLVVRPAAASCEINQQNSMRRINSVAKLGESPVTRVLAGCLAFILLWVILMAARGGGIDALIGMAGGRSAASSRIVEDLPLAIYCLPAASTLTAATWRALRERNGWSLSSSEKLIYWIIVLVSLLPPLMLGNRRFVLPCVVAAVIAANLSPRRWNARIKIWQLSLAVFVFLLLAIVPFVRSSGSRNEGDSLIEALFAFIQTEGVGGVLTNFFTSYDTEMLDYIAYVAPRLGGELDYGLGRGTLQDVLLTAVPARIADTQSWSNEVLITLFGQPCGSGICPVPSFAGTAFFDFGYIGVVILGLVVGGLCRLFETAIIRPAGFGLVAVLVVGALPATAIRGNYPSQLWIAVNIMVTACVLSWAITRSNYMGRAIRNNEKPPASLSAIAHSDSNHGLTKKARE